MITESGAAAVVETPAAEVPVSADAPAVETPVTEPAAEAVKEEPKRDPVSAKFAALSRREKEAQQAQHRVKQAEAELTRRQQEIDAKIAAMEERERRARDPSLRPIDRAHALGITPEEINRDLLGGWTAPEKDPLAEKLSPLQKQLEEVVKQNEELRKKVEGVDEETRRRKQNEDYLKFVDGVKATVESDVNKYEYLQLNGKEAIDLVQETMLSYYQANNNTLLSYEEACDLVEEYYEGQAEKYSKAKKLQAKFPAATPPQKPQDTAKAKDEPKTLTSSMSTGAQETVDISKMSDSEQLAYIAKMIQIKKS